MSTTATENPTKLITPKVRFSYLHVWEPTAMEDGQDKKYSVSLLIRKTEKKFIEQVKAAIKTAFELGKQKYGASWKPKDPDPLKDGDVDRPDDEVYAGCYYISAKAKTKPGIVDKDVQAILNQDELYSGCYGRASINFYPYEKGKGGVTCGLNNIQKLEDGEPLGGRSSAESDFGAENAPEDDIL